MKVDVVADVGNSRIKWGRCARGKVTDECCSLPADDALAWQEQFERWKLKDSHWAIAGVHPERRDQLVEWLKERAARVVVLDRAEQLGIEVVVEHPDRVGIDRLLNAVAVVRGQPLSKPLYPDGAVIVDAGSAVTVDVLDERGRFRGGAIFPGLRLMAKALHDYTALLPLVDCTGQTPPVPAPSTEKAIQGGVYFAVAGGINALLRTMQKGWVYVTGGDGPLFKTTIGGAHVIFWPEMTLTGLRLAAEALP